MEFWKFVRLVSIFFAIALESLMINSIIPIIPQLLKHPLCGDAVCTNQEPTVNSTDAIDHGDTGQFEIMTDQVITPVATGQHLLSISDTEPTTYDSTELKLTLLFLSNSLVGFIFASPISGVAADKFGYDIVLLVCLFILLIESLIFAFCRHYLAYVIAKILEGISSAGVFGISPAAVCSMFMNDDSMRTKMIGVSIILFGFTNLGPVYMGATYHSFGQTVAFLLQTGAIAITISTLLISSIVLKLKHVPDNASDRQRVNNEGDKSTEQVSFIQLILDPLVVIPVVLCISGLVRCAQQPVISLWLVDKFNSDTVQRGIIWLPVFMVHVIGTGVGLLLSRRNVFLIIAILMVSNAVLIAIMPFSPNFQITTIIYTVINFNESIFRFFIINHIAYISANVYPTAMGRVYSLTKMGKDGTYLIGAAVAPVIYVRSGYRNLNFIIAAVLLAASPLSLVASVLMNRKKRAMAVPDPSVHGVSPRGSTKPLLGTPGGRVE